MTFLLVSAGVGFVVICFFCAEIVAGILSRAFRHRLDAPTHVAVTHAETPGGVIEYGRAESKSPVIERRPWLAAVAGVVATGWMVAAIALFSWMSMVANAFPGLPSVVTVMAALALAAMIVISLRAVRLRDGLPAGARWHKRQIGLIGVGVLLAYVVGAVIVDARIGAMLKEASEQSTAELTEIQAQGEGAERLYNGAFNTVLQHADLYKWDEWNYQVEPGYATPPAFPKELMPAIDGAMEASRAKQIDFGTNLPQQTVLTNLTHLAPARTVANTLKWHALDNARNGDWAGAMRDVAAQRALARQIAERANYIGLLVGIGTDALAATTVEECLPFVTDEQQLAQVPFGDEAWYVSAALESMHIERLLTRRQMAELLLSMNMGAPGAERSVKGMPLRLVFGRREIEVLEEGFDAVTARLQQLEEIPALHDTRVYDPQGRGALIVTILLPSMERAGTTVYRALQGERQLRLAVEVTRYRLRHGALPRSWDEMISAGLLKEVPMDPWDGKPLRFVWSEEEVLIYSIGDNRKDDHAAAIVDRGDVKTRIATKPLWVLHPPKPVEDADMQDMPAELLGLPGMKELLEMQQPPAPDAP